ncbi:baseplate J/gp47 family protein [Sphingobium sp. WCS2017Hpa-17]|uniref:baseplate J/gp47 family protein n=1 Tax=Sphingobium sp. WCS2017Hpa-17 TaxID=3073638 RepID=UPI0028891AA9|nr:baseplate J/gp47 family protein [Sphingobium sp. WCS2017Hpa-17]
MSNVPHPIFSATGVAAPTESAISTGLWADFQAAFEGILNESPATPQGQLITSLAAILGANNDLFLQFVNQVDPAFADGRMQDAIGRIYYLARIGAQATVVTCNCVGGSGTLIPAGSLAQATDGTIYESVASATIGISGSVSVVFRSTATGPVACPAGTLNVIYRVVQGWDSVSNPSDGVIGRGQETRAEFETRRSASVAQNARSVLDAVRGAVLSVAGVTDAYVTENPTNAPVTVGGVTLAAHSLYVCAYGGSNANVAKAIWTKKPPGCGYNGSTTVTVVDDSSGYGLPLPSYPVTFQRPDPLPIYFGVSIANGPQVPSNAAALVKDAIVAAFNGDDGGARARIGGTVFALRYATPIAALGSWAQLVSITVGIASSPTSAEVAVDIDQVPTIDPGHISVALV